VAWTLHSGREAFEHRRVLTVRDSADAIQLLEEPDATRVHNHQCELDRPSLVFMYPGGGAQYVRMAQGLYEAEPVFRENVEQYRDPAFAELELINTYFVD